MLLYYASDDSIFSGGKIYSFSNTGHYDIKTPLSLVRRRVVRVAKSQDCLGHQQRRQHIAQLVTEMGGSLRIYVLKVRRLDTTDATCMHKIDRKHANYITRPGCKAVAT